MEAEEHTLGVWDTVGVALKDPVGVGDWETDRERDWVLHALELGVVVGDRETVGVIDPVGEAEEHSVEVCETLLVTLKVPVGVGD